MHGRRQGQLVRVILINPSRQFPRRKRNKASKTRSYHQYYTCRAY